MGPSLASIGKLDSLSMRRAVLVERVESAGPEQSAFDLEALFASSGRGNEEATSAALAVATWIMRSDRPDVACDGHLLRAHHDPVLDSLRASISSDETPLVAHVLLQPRGAEQSRPGRGDGAILVQDLHALTRADLLREAERWGGDAPNFAPYLPSHEMELLVRALRVRGSGAWRQLGELLDKPRLRASIVIRMAAARALPSEVAYALALRDRWMGRHDVRAALAMNRATPPALVGALLPTVGVQIASLVAERARFPSVRAAALAFAGRRIEHARVAAELP